jgi:hypothetical protein
MATHYNHSLLACFHIEYVEWVAHLDIYLLGYRYRDTKLVERFYERPFFTNVEKIYLLSKQRLKEIDYYLDAIWC